MFSAIADCKEISITLPALITIRSAVRSVVSYRIRVLITADQAEEIRLNRPGRKGDNCSRVTCNLINHAFQPLHMTVGKLHLFTLHCV